MELKTGFLVIVAIFSCLLISLGILAALIDQQAIDWRLHDSAADSIATDVNNLSYFAVGYLFGTNDLSQFNVLLTYISSNISFFENFDLPEKTLVTQIQQSVSSLRQLSDSMSTSSNMLNNTQKLTFFWGQISGLISNLTASSSRLATSINNGVNQLAQENAFVLTSLIVTSIAFIGFMGFQIFGRTLKSIDKLQRNHLKLETTKKQLEMTIEERDRQLKDAERMVTIGQVAGMIGHDIRNPLQAIVADVYLLKTEYSSLPESESKVNMKESFEGIEENLAYISKIVADLQDYARPLNPEFQDVDLSKLLISVFETVSVPDKIAISVNVKGFPGLKTDPMFIRRALTNLVNNAIQAMPNGGKLDIAGFEKENKAYITVADTGVGIPEEVRLKLFTPMVTTKAKGQGFGLAVVKRLVEALNGNVRFESQEGKGTKFIIELPLTH